MFSLVEVVGNADDTRLLCETLVNKIVSASRVVWCAIGEGLLLKLVLNFRKKNFQAVGLEVFQMVGVAELESATPCVSCKCSNQLSYTPVN